MKPFTYERPATPEAAARALATPGAKLIAGGTNLLDLMKLEIETPRHLIDLTRLGLDQTEATPEGGLTGEIRLRRMLGVFAAGRILNEKTTNSQAIGAMIWGVGMALHEDAVIDPHYGCFANHDLAGYHVPGHADIPAIEVHFLEEIDDKTNPLKIKGVGELGICGAGAAVANAVYNACGVRIREFPLTLDKVLAGLEHAHSG